MAVQRRANDLRAGRSLEHLCRKVAFEHSGVDIVFPAGRRAIPQFGRSLFDRRDDIPLGLRFAGCPSQPKELSEHLTGAMPRAEIFGSDVRASYLAQVVIHIARTDGLKLPG